MIQDHLHLGNSNFQIINQLRQVKQNLVTNNKRPIIFALKKLNKGVVNWINVQGTEAENEPLPLSDINEIDHPNSSTRSPYML